MKIAVIGSGIAGLTTAWLLTREGKHSVTLFERAPRLGMDASGVDVDLNKLRAAAKAAKAADAADGNAAAAADAKTAAAATTVGDAPASAVSPGSPSNGASPGSATRSTGTVRIDVPLRVFTESYYPNLSSLYSEIGIAISPEDYASSFSELNGPSIFNYRNFLIGKRSIPFPAPTKWNDFTYWKILGETLYFLWTSPKHLQNGSLRGKTFNEYVVAHRYSSAWVERFALPALAGICTCSFKAVRAYPAQIVVHYVLTRSMFGVRRACGGTEEVVARLAAGATVKCNSNVRYIESIDDGTRVRLVMGSGEGGKVAESEEFDHVILATQANQALGLIKEPSDKLRGALEGFEYEKSSLVLHTDPALMPRERANWRSVNFILEPQCTTPKPAATANGTANGHVDASAAATAAAVTVQAMPGSVGRGKCTAIRGEGMATIWMNRVHHDLYAIKDVNVFQTWNPIIAPRPGTVLCGGEFERPVVTFKSVDAIGALWAAQGQQRLWFVGSYSLYGMPLLETAVSSAIQVASRLGSPCPWAARVRQFEAASPTARGTADDGTAAAAAAGSIDVLEHLKLPPRSAARRAVGWLPALFVFVVLFLFFRRSH